MKWLLVVFATSFGETPKTILEIQFETQQLCQSAVIEVGIQLGDTDKSGMIKVFPFCVQISN